MPISATLVQNPPIRKRSLRRFFLRVLVLFIVISLGGALFCLVKMKSSPLTISWLAIKEVTVTAEWPLTESSVRSWLPSVEGRNIFWVNANDLIEKVENKPWVAEVVVKKEFPDRLVVDVAAKKAVAVGRIDGRIFWLDAQGGRIEKVTPLMAKTLELPIVSLDSNRASVDLSLAVGILQKLSKALAGQAEISQVSFLSAPLFKVYLSNPRAEVTFSTENWESQTPYLIALLKSALSATPQLQRINLVFPKKAVVSSFLSN